MAPVEFDPSTVLHPEREASVWASAARRQIERWEPLVAKFALSIMQANMQAPPDPPIEMTTAEILQGENERHFLLIAAAQLVKALRMLDPAPVLDPMVADELTETRDLSEHWEDNQPVFNVMQAQPDGPPRRMWEPGRRSGRAFAARNPRGGPYDWWAWNGEDGPLVTPNVPATAVHDLIESAIVLVGTTHPYLVEDIPPPAPRPWHMPTAPGAPGWTPKLDAVP